MTTTKAPMSERSLLFLAIGVALVTAIVGVFILLSRYEYAEDGTDTLIMAYLGASVLLFFALRFWNMALTVISVFVIIATQIYAVNKFNWREDYIVAAQAGKPFFFEEYIDHYPTYEEHIMPFSDMPDWVGFNEQCVQPGLAGQSLRARCQTLELIQRYFNIDVVAAMQAQYAKMQETARKVEAGELNKRSDYAACLADKTCATIPLLPKTVDPKTIDPTTRDYIGVRQTFWSLVNDKQMTPQVCAAMSLCYALVSMKVIDPEKLPLE